MARYVLVDGGIVDNVIEWDGDAEAEDAWAPPKGMIAIASDEAQIGWSYADGAFTPPAPPPPVVPQAVTPRQLKLALLGADLLDDIEAFIASGAVPRKAVISWEDATEYRRDDPMLNEMAAHLTPPLSAEQIDQLFIAAAAIP